MKKEGIVCTLQTLLFSSYTLFPIFVFSVTLWLFYAPSCYASLETEKLPERATNPITNLLQLQFENDVTFTNKGSPDASNVFYVKPLIPILSHPFPQLIRFKIPVSTLPRSYNVTPATILSDIQFFDLIVFDYSWGRWGIGPVMFFPTATKLEGGSGKWQLGPAIGFSYTGIPTWQFGFLSQNPISFAGNHHTPAVNTQYFQPFITKHFAEGWYFSFNPTWVIQWNARNTQIPINMGFGRVFSIGSLKLDVTLQYQFLAYYNSASVVPNQTLQISWAILFD
jgi:hypothetical protein